MEHENPNSTNLTSGERTASVLARQFTAPTEALVFSRTEYLQISDIEGEIQRNDRLSLEGLLRLRGSLEVVIRKRLKAAGLVAEPPSQERD